MSIVVKEIEKLYADMASNGGILSPELTRSKKNRMLI